MDSGRGKKQNQTTKHKTPLAPVWGGGGTNIKPKQSKRKVPNDFSLAGRGDTRYLGGFRVGGAQHRFLAPPLERGVV